MNNSSAFTTNPQEEFERKLKVFGDLSEDQKAAITCAVYGHSKVVHSYFGYITCARCEATLGDSLLSLYGGSDDLVIFGDQSEENKQRYSILTWEHKHRTADPFYVAPPAPVRPERRIADTLAGELNRKDSEGHYIHTKLEESLVPGWLSVISTENPELLFLDSESQFFVFRTRSREFYITDFSSDKLDSRNRYLRPWTVQPIPKDDELYETLLEKFGE